MKKVDKGLEVLPAVETVLACAIQIRASPDIEDNLARAGDLVRRAAARGARLAVLPEMFATGYDAVPWEEAAEGPVGPTTAALGAWARETGMHLVAALPQRTMGAIRDTAVLVGPQGPVARYAKRHLWKEEQSRLVAGDVPVVHATPIGHAGFLVCYDLEFPEAATPYGAAGVVAILACAAFSTETIWDVATRARALETGAFVVAANLVGGAFCGGSRVVAPDARVLAEVAKGEGIALAEVDASRYEAWRAAHPYARDRIRGV